MPECSFPALQQLVGNAPVSPSGSVMAAFIPQNEKWPECAVSAAFFQARRRIRFTLP
jgi:hypothetical protein